MPDHPHGFWSVVPPLLTLALAMITRRILVSLLAGVALGIVVMQDWSGAWSSAEPWLGAARGVDTHLWGSIVNPSHVRVFVFDLLMGAMVGVVHRCGGMHGIVNTLGRLARDRMRGQLAVWGMGLTIFFDDYANCLLLGTTSRALCDKLRISREKLAFIVDSTAAPVAGLAVVSTWVATEIGYITEGMAGLPLATPVSGFDVLLATLPYRHYAWWMLAWVVLTAVMKRDFGPMWTAEMRAIRRPEGQPPPEPSSIAELPEPEPTAAAHWVNAAVPIGLMVLTVMVLLAATGHAAAVAQNVPPTLVNIIGRADSYIALVYGSLVGLLAAMFMACRRRLLTSHQAGAAALQGAAHMVTALGILWLAWSLSSVIGDAHLATGKYLAAQLRGVLDPRWMPTIVFVLCALVSLVTGTSWGTMGILMPIVIKLTHHLLADQAPHLPVDPLHPLMLATIGSVLAGSIWGDHCSPVSDTTILSSQASGCDHMAHVWTQLPYAIAVGLIVLLCGTLPVGFGLPVAWTHPLGLAAMISCLCTLGKPAR